MNGKLRVGDAVMTRAGTLPCKCIVHTVGPHWLGGRQGEEDSLFDCVFQCLSAAQNKGFQSIAFPAISVGIFGVPVKIGTQSIVEAVHDFLAAEDGDCTIKVSKRNHSNIQTGIFPIKRTVARGIEEVCVYLVFISSH